MAYGKLKADSIIYDDSGSDVEKTIASLASAASTASPTFTGDVTLTGAANNVVFDASDNALEFADNAKATFGAGADLEIYHSGSHSNIKDSGTGQLNFWSNTFQWYNAAGSKTSMKIVEDAQVELYHDNSKKIETTAAGVTVSGSVTDSKGNVRSIPQQNEQGSAHTLVAADAGKHILADATVTAPPTSGIFSAGDAITIINTSGSNISIARGSGVTIYNSADGANADRTLGTKGMATLLCAGSDTYYISGSGLS